MRINYNVTGQERKKLVEAVSEITGEPATYMGAPTFGYEVGIYYIDKTGVLIGDGDAGLVDSLKDRGFIAEESQHDDQHDPVQCASPIAPVAELEETDHLVIEVPAEDFNDRTFDNLEKIVASKANLIKKALDAETLPIQRTQTTIKFPWFKLEGDSGEVEAYTAFVSGLCDLAKKQLRVTAKERMVENEKYTFRVFLIRLGFVGDEYKAARKLLMKSLSGNSAFRDGIPESKDGGNDE